MIPNPKKKNYRPITLKNRIAKTLKEDPAMGSSKFILGMSELFTFFQLINIIHFINRLKKKHAPPDVETYFKVIVIKTIILA